MHISFAVSYKLFLLFITVVICKGKKDLRCYTCLNTDCSGKGRQCLETNGFVTAALSPLYYLEKELQPCPNTLVNWKFSETSTKPCPEERYGEATCSLGRMRIKTVTMFPNGSNQTTVTYGTVFGCAKRMLLRRVRDAYKFGEICDSFQHESSKYNGFRELEIKHCHDVTTLCYRKDFCTNWTDSAVIPWEEDALDETPTFTKSVWHAVITIMVLLATFSLGMFLWRKFRECTSSNQPSNFTLELGVRNVAVNQNN